jgi:hypothetical protein
MAEKMAMTMADWHVPLVPHPEDISKSIQIHPNPSKSIQRGAYSHLFNFDSKKLQPLPFGHKLIVVVCLCSV